MMFKQSRPWALARLGQHRGCRPISVYQFTRKTGGTSCRTLRERPDVDPRLEASKVLEELKLTEDEAATAADELDERGWAKRHLYLGMGKVGFGWISPTALLFFNLDPHVKGWNPEEDARALASALVNTGGDIVSLSEADQMLGWGPRRFNPAAQYLDLHNVVSGLAAIGCEPYAFQYLQVTPRTRRFASQ